MERREDLSAARERVGIGLWWGVRAESRHLDARRIAGIGAAAFAGAECDLLREQAVRGVDALDEREVQGILASAFGGEGWGVLRESPYPTPPSRRAGRGERARCDIVLTPRPGERLRDAVEIARARDELETTLFAGVARETIGIDGVDPRDAVWIEVKTMGQFACVSGVPGPNRGYGSELVRGAAADAKKLAADAMIERGFVVVVLFASDASVAEHDLGVLAHRLLDVGSPISMPAIETTRIADRMGNGVCAVWAAGVRSPD